MEKVLKRFGFEETPHWTGLDSYTAKWGEVEVQAIYDPKHGANVFLRHTNAKEGNGKFNFWGDCKMELRDHIIAWQVENLPKVILKDVTGLKDTLGRGVEIHQPYENKIVPQGLCVLVNNQGTPQISIVLSGNGLGDYRGDIGTHTYLGENGSRYASLGEVIKYRPSLLNVSLVG